MFVDVNVLPVDSEDLVEVVLHKLSGLCRSVELRRVILSPLLFGQLVLDFEPLRDFSGIRRLQGAAWIILNRLSREFHVLRLHLRYRPNLRQPLTLQHGIFDKEER